MALLAVVGCSGGADGGAAPPPTPTGIGPAGGTVTDPSGAQVVIPAGALATNTAIAVAQSSAGAPPLPAGVTSVGQMYAFTPHGTSFAVAVTITVPFDVATLPVGATPVLYKTNAAMSGWDAVAGAIVSGSTMSGQVNGFSIAIVALPPPAEGSLTEKSWDLHVSSRSKTSYLANNIHDANGKPPSVPADSVPQIGGIVDLKFGIGQPTKHPPGPDSGAPNVNAFSNVTAKTFYTEAIAPMHTPFDADNFEQASSTLKQRSTYRAIVDHPSLAFHITAVRAEAIDGGGNPIGRTACPFMTANPSQGELDLCLSLITFAVSSFELKAYSDVDNGTFYDVGNSVSLSGQHGQWDWNTNRFGDQAQSIWGRQNFSANLDVDNDATTGNQGRHAKVELAAPITLNVPLGHLKKNDIFTVEIAVTSSADNHIQGESYVAAYFRDPSTASGLDGVSIEFAGLEPIPLQNLPTGLPPLACSSGPDPAAGQIQFTAADFSAPEGSNEAQISIERVNGTQGEVRVLLQTSDGSALAGSDYQPIAKTVRFADGESGSVVVAVPLMNDSVEEPAEALTATLSQPGGCASLGAQSTATLAILDDDAPLPPPATYTVGGTVSGLTGSGLVLRQVTDGTLSVTNGAFTFPATLFSGIPYEVRVETQPTNPIQICSVANGVGTIANANVTNVAVTCATPAPNGSLDPSFGNGGKVASNIAYITNTVNSRMGMALQADGRILLVGGQKLLRFNSDGTPDASFGTAGVVTVPFNATPFDYAQDVAVQTDGRIVVVGTLSVPGAVKFDASKQDFALARFNADGTMDTSFGTGGKVTTDFNGNQDVARHIVIQADGKLLVSGFSTRTVPTPAKNEYAVARYNVDGSPDSSFNFGRGQLSTGFAGTINWVQGLTVQRDGKIVMVGKTAADGGTPNTNVGLVRLYGVDTVVAGVAYPPGDNDRQCYEPMVDPFGNIVGSGHVSTDLNVGGVDAVGVVEQPGVDGQLLVAAWARGRFALATFLNQPQTDGTVWGGFYPSSQQPTVIDISGKTDYPHAMALQHDGKVLIVGSTGAGDMGIARFTPGVVNASVDTTFGTNGSVTVDFFGGGDSADAVAVQPDGKIIVGGLASNAGTVVFALARLMP